jgi:hypothetical protein
MPARRGLDEPAILSVVHRVRDLNLGQRLVLVVALGVVLRLIGTYIVTKGNGPSDGWFGYAPGTDVIFRDDRLGPGATVLVWVALTAVWATASLWLLGTRQQPNRDDG